MSIDIHLPDIAADLVQTWWPRSLEWFLKPRRDNLLEQLRGPLYSLSARVLYLDADLREFGATTIPLSGLERAGIRILRQERNRLAAMKE